MHYIFIQYNLILNSAKQEIFKLITSELAQVFVYFCLSHSIRLFCCVKIILSGARRLVNLKSNT